MEHSFRTWKGHNSGSKASLDIIPQPFDVEKRKTAIATRIGARNNFRKIQKTSKNAYDKITTDSAQKTNPRKEYAWRALENKSQKKSPHSQARKNLNQAQPGKQGLDPKQARPAPARRGTSLVI